MTSTDTPTARLARRLGRGARRLGRGARRLTPTPAPRPVWLRLATIVTGLLWLAGAWVVLGFFSVPSGVHGWLPTTAALLPGMLLLTLGGGIARSRPAQAAAGVAAAAMLGGWLHYNAVPDFERLRATADEVGTPAGWHLHDEQVLGNTWGLWSSWPELTRTYGTTDSPAEAEADVVALLEDHGWDPVTGTPRDPGGGYVRWEHWNRAVSLRIESPGDPSRRYDTGPDAVPDDLTKVTLIYR